VRDYQDPEFEAAFRKLNTQLLFDQFMARPMQTRPEELSEDFMKPEHLRKMSRRDLARAAFVREFKKKQAIKQSLKLQVEVELEKMKDFEEGVAGHKKMNYAELVDELNKDQRAIEQIDRPIVLYKSEQEIEVARKKEVEKKATNIKRVTYPFWALAIIVNSLLMVGYYQQD